MTSLFELLSAEIEQTARWDRSRLRRRLDSLRRNAGDDRKTEESLAGLEAEVRQAAARFAARRDGAPKPSFDDALPVSARRQEIADAVRENPVVVVCGETGSGKSTQLPKICLELGRGIDGMIGHTQPRRIAARSVASRVAMELGSSLGDAVGYQVRFHQAVSDRTCVKVMTDGILLAELPGDPLLDRYDTIIIDEAHERSLNIDFLLGYLKRLLPQRPDLKLIITSATIDADRFAEHFRGETGPAPVIRVTGRTFPVEVLWRPTEPDADGGEPDPIRAAANAVEEAARLGAGDVLVFMPTERDIHETAKLLRGSRLAGESAENPTEILPLYARLSMAEQQRVFEPHAGRRIVIATNVAESSLTVPNVRFVVDPGTARISRYSARSKTQRLPIERISQASADQRLGRCGRTGPGVCLRLFSEDDFTSRDRYTAPEIQRTNLASVILRMKALRLGNVEDFPFLDAPRPEAVRDGYKTLLEIGALDAEQRLTPIGRVLSRMPVDPRIGRMILAGREEGCLSEILIIAAALEIQDPRDRPADRAEEADQCHSRYFVPDSDFLGHLKLWDAFGRMRAEYSRNQVRKACRDRFLSYNRMREWADIHRELLELARESRWTPGRRKDKADAVHRAVLAGLISSTAVRTDKYLYSAVAGGKFNIWPGSACFESRPRWVVAAELVETRRRYLRTCARIQRSWIEAIAPHLLQRFYSNLRWEAGLGGAAADERVLLFDLTLVPRRIVPYGPVDPKAAREIFIEFGLVEGLLWPRPDFLEHNLALQKNLETLREKLRNNEALVDRWTRYAFYERRIPRDVFDNQTLGRWIRTARIHDPHVLCMARSDLLWPGVPEPAEGEYPDQFTCAAGEWPLVYRFEPTAEDDGLTLVAPAEAIGQLDADQLEWLVPGLAVKKIEMLIRSLPKELRRLLVPTAEAARRAMDSIPFGEGRFLPAVAQALTRLAAHEIPVEAFQWEKVPPEFRMNVRAISTDGQMLAQSRDLGDLKKRLGIAVAEVLASAEDSPWVRDGLTAWDFDELPAQIELRRPRATLKAFPALVDQGETVSLRLVESAAVAEFMTRGGLRRLALLACRREIGAQVQWIPRLDTMRVHAAGVGVLVDCEIAELIADRAFLAAGAIPRHRAEFDAWLVAGRERIAVAVQDVVEPAGPLWESFYDARLAIEKATASVYRQAVADIRRQIAGLVFPGFMTATPWEWLSQFPRYFRAIAIRLDRLGAGNRDRDLAQTEELRLRADAMAQRLKDRPDLVRYDPAWIRYRWLLEEYRVSLFAQKLGTAVAVSAVRLDRLWESLPSG